jgi:copper transport protein
VLLLIAAGATLACLQLGRLGELFATAYGIRLVSKLAFVLVLLLFAALNRFWLMPALAARHGQAAHRLRISIGLEIVLAIAILAATSSLGEVPPPRALILEAEAQAANAQAANGTAMDGMDMGEATIATKPGFSVVTFAEGGRGAEIELSPARAGTNTITIHLFGAAERPLPAQQVTIELSQPAAGVEPMEHKLTAESPGLYRWANAPMPLAGKWKIQLLVLISDFEEIRFETLVPLR